MNRYELYYVDRQYRLESMMVCSLKNEIDWCEDGLKAITWKYNMVACGKADSLEDVFKRHSALNIDKRRKKQIRTIGMGDVIVFNDEPWMVSAFGFSLVPHFLWEKILAV